MNSQKIRIWALLLLLTCCSILCSTTFSLLPARSAAAPALSLLL